MERISRLQTEVLSYIERNAKTLALSGEDSTLSVLIRRLANLEVASVSSVYTWEASDLHGNCLQSSGTAASREEAYREADAFCASHPFNQFHITVSGN